MKENFYGVYEEVWHQWNDFQNTMTISKQIVRSEILKSWERSKIAGVDPYQEQGQEIIEGAALKEVREKQEELIQAARPIMEKLLSLSGDYGFLAVLVGEDGYILETLGNHQETIDLARRTNFIPGACWREDKVGTNGIGTAMVIGQALDVTGAEHFSRGLHSWTCTGSPIFSPEGKPIGVIDLSGPWYRENKLALATIVSSAIAIENNLKQSKAFKETLPYRQLSEYFLENNSDPLLVMDNTGRLIKVNYASEKFLGWKKEDLIGRRADEIFDNSQEILFLIKARQSIKNKEILVQSRKGILRCSADVSPISGYYNENVAALIALKMHEGSQFYISSPPALKGFEVILGNHPCLRESIRLAQIAANSDAPVLILGETGTGKDLFARAIHEASGRKGPFVAINGGALPRELIGSELFGYVGGAFTGARPDGKPGKFEQAQGGTLFLDEIGDMPMDIQVYLLRVLEEKKVVRIGGHKEIPLDVRIIAATNSDLTKLVREKKFREDLYYRLRVLTIHLCPLRERKSDIPLLFQHFVNKFSQKLGKNITNIDPSIWPLLSNYDWPGNIRELRNVAEWAVNIAEGSTISVNHLPPYLSGSQTIRENSSTFSSTSLIELEKQEISRLLEHYGGNITKVAEALGIARNTLYRKLYKYGLKTRYGVPKSNVTKRDISYKEAD
ncbi:PAS domain S-box [Thermoanaerobacter thermohydrosulfuricus WC1]|uniref:PAS domain S-box n=1 Tax=Thermoanaerobacter thermohydrosulfuricus WC1 TaxID=1198630 RepID=M8CX10_THETY|nr:sigma-54-dependent Fis family transcriptional regulator [Thermoanaerobacter thermohydrosulfuricus]EMT38909.1 PAS domain S-box [Thermoanaerobacter thermohydrosulfuricus WC1]SFE78646.1 PAS domain S-box-containing protein [Thermoanaerobacter thermohydrosulfuricus]